MEFQKNRNTALMQIVLAVMICLPTIGLAADKKPGDVKVSTPVYRPEFSPALGTYVYEVSWQGIPAAEATVGVERDGMTYKIWSKARTYSAIDLFYTLRYKAKASLSVVDFAPTQTHFYTRENSRIKEAEITFMPNGDIHSVRLRKGEEPKYERFHTDNFTLDPFSAAFIARAVDWEVGKENVFDAYNGKSRYLISLKAVEKITMEVNDVETPVWVIKPKVKNLLKSKQSKLRDAKIYMTADSYREILKIESEVFIGTVKTKLESFKPTNKATHGIQVAAHYLNGEDVSF